MCGDVVVNNNVNGGAEMSFPLAVDAEVVCGDENGDGILDLAICFTWRTEENNGSECKFESNVPATSTGACNCAMYPIANVGVAVVKDDVPPCS